MGHCSQSPADRREGRASRKASSSNEMLSSLKQLPLVDLRAQAEDPECGRWNSGSFSQQLCLSFLISKVGIIALTPEACGVFFLFYFFSF